MKLKAKKTLTKVPRKFFFKKNEEQNEKQKI